MRIVGCVVLTGCRKPDAIDKRLVSMVGVHDHLQLERVRDNQEATNHKERESQTTNQPKPDLDALTQ